MLQLRQGVSFSMKFTVVLIFLFLTGLTVTLALSLQYYFSQSLAKDAADTHFSQLSQKVAERVHVLDSESISLAELLTEFPDIDYPAQEYGLHPAIQVMAKSMDLNPYLYAVYVGYQNGDIYSLVNLNNDPKVRENLAAGLDDRWMVMKVINSKEGRVRIEEFYDDDFQLNSRRQQASSYYSFDRPWYRQAVTSDEVIKTAPYIFHQNQSPGVTFARQLGNNGVVVAIDISLSTISDFLRKQRFLPSSETMIFGQDGTLSAHSFDVTHTSMNEAGQAMSLTEEEQAYIGKLGTITVSNELSWPPYDFSHAGDPLGYSIDFVKLLAKKSGLEIKFINGYHWHELLELFQTHRLDLVHSIYGTEERENWGLLTEPYLHLPNKLVTRAAAGDITSMSQLSGKTLVIPKGWHSEVSLRQRYPEVNLMLVDDSLEALKAVANQQAFATIETDQVVRYLSQTYFIHDLKIHPELSELTEFNQSLQIIVHHDQPMLRDILNRAMDAITPAELEELKQSWLVKGNTSEMQRSINAGVVPHPQFLELATLSLEQGLAQTELTLNGRSYLGYVSRIDSIFDSQELLGILVPFDEVMAPFMSKVNLSILFTLILLMLLLPIVVYFADMIAKPVNNLAKENKKIRDLNFKAIQRVPSHIRELIELSESMTSMAEAIDAHQQSQHSLLDSFIRLIAQAIDEKSPYTGDHCKRVPELAVMLAEAATQSQSEAFKDFELQSENQWREFKIAAWLHDCGKVATPEHIVDKGSKLETIYNRIHEIRTRFEVLWRDAQIEYWKGLSEGQPELQLKQRLTERQAQIKDDFEFIARSNVGSEYMDDAQLERIKQIGNQSWVRHFDNQLGLSPEELRRCKKSPQPLPTTETLLTDDPDHLIDWPKRPQSCSDLGFDQKAPPYQANIGEIYNLSIRKGTLTPEERFRINEHVTITMRMLNELPLPQELSRVPEYAGSHHETLIGTGYPRKLDASQLAIPSRILAVADVFEALTAGDRPYKDGKTLSQSIQLLYSMAKAQHLDMDLVKLLLSSGIYQRYAERFLEPGQIDEVDLGSYLSS